MNSILNWLDHRTGYRSILRGMLYESVPGGARWRYVWGSTLTFVFFVQFVTGIVLWMHYSPSTQTAWESVYFIQNEMFGGWLLRGIHHYAADIMVILLVLHLMQVVIDGAYKAPREVNLWLGLVLMGLTLAFALTGYLLPWDQKGFWATRVATSLVTMVPYIGPELQRLVIGGADYGHFTLTRFFALHAGILPALTALLIVGHIYLFRRHGITAKRPLRKGTESFWPDQLLKDMVACLAVLAAIGVLVFRHSLFGGNGPLGAELMAPADPSEPFSAARPEWYFLFLFQLLKYFPGETEVWGAIYLPCGAFLVLLLMPLFGKWRVGHYFNVVLVCGLLLGAVVLSGLAIVEDRSDPNFVQAQHRAEKRAERVKALASSPKGIPPAGAISLLRNDPYIQGPQLYAENCAKCHHYGGHDGMGNKPEDPPSAPDLKGFASREWIRGLMDPEKVDSPHYYGNTAFKDGDMVEFVKEDVASYSESEKKTLDQMILALSAEADLPYQSQVDKRDSRQIRRGSFMLKARSDCTDCHEFHNQDDTATGPDLTGYGSREWLISIISDPEQPHHYGDDNDGMPAFGREKILTEREIGLIADWLRRDWYRPDPEQAEKTTGSSQTNTPTSEARLSQ